MDVKTPCASFQGLFRLILFVAQDGGRTFVDMALIVGIVARAWATYQQLLITHPWKTQTIGTGIVVAIGDVVTQQFVEQKGLKHDFVRTARMGVVGLIIGPVLRTWFLTLDRIVPGAAKTAGFQKMLLDQILFAPVMICFFFGITETLAGKRLRDIKEMLQERYRDTLITNYKIWPLAQTLNFTFVPIQHRVGFVQIVALFWNAYLSWMTNKPLPEPALNSVNSIQ